MIYLVLLLGLILRLFLLPLPPFGIDMNDWMAWADHLLSVGPDRFYETVWSDYLPAYLYVLWFLAEVHRVFSFFPYEILMKIPAVLADLGIGWLIYKIVKRDKSEKFALFGEKLCLLVSSLYLFNPFSVFNSSVWGQVDSVFAFFLLAGVYLLLKKKYWGAWGILGFSFLLKPQAVFFVPLFWLCQLKEKQKLSRILTDGLILTGVIFLVSLPFFISDPLLGLPKLILKSTSTYPYTSIFAMNFWGIFGTWKPDATVLFNLSYQAWGMLFLGLGLILAWLSFLKNKKTFAIYLSSSLIVLAFFMLPTRVHERWLYPFFPFFLVWAALVNSFKGWFVYLLLSVFHSLNLYFVYTYYNPNFLKINWLSELIANNFNWFAFLSFIMYGFLLVSTLKERLDEKY